MFFGKNAFIFFLKVGILSSELNGKIPVLDSLILVFDRKFPFLVRKVYFLPLINVTSFFSNQRGAFSRAGSSYFM